MASLKVTPEVGAQVPIDAPEVSPQQQASDKAYPRVKGYGWMSVDKWKELHKDDLKRAKEGGVSVLFLGDSITEGWSGAGSKTWAQHLEPLGAANFGIGGDTTQNVLWRITDGKVLEAASPKVVVLMIGTNNFGLAQHSPDAVIQGVTAVVQTLGDKLPESKVLLLGIFPRNAEPKALIREEIQTVNEALAKLNDGQRVHYRDIGEVFLESDGSIDPAIMPDYLHLSSAGYKRWWDVIREDLQRLMK